MTDEIKYTNLKDMASTVQERADGDGIIMVADYRIQPCTFKDGNKGILLRVKDVNGVYYNTCGKVMVKSFIESLLKLDGMAPAMYVETRISKQSGKPYTVICPCIAE
jgi:hypothetical protein|nr:MAG TPA_asm: hypothetical protein [Caudoviricetes sp.]